jgi:hypothetical protein
MSLRLGFSLSGLLALALASSASAAFAPGGGEFLVTRTVDSQQGDPVATFGPGGVSLIVWADSRYGVRGQLFDPEGAKRGGTLGLAPNRLPSIPGEGPAALGAEPAAVFLADGGFLLVWAEERGYLRVAAFHQKFDLEERRVMARRFNASGEAAGRVFAISSSTDRLESWPRIHALADGRVLAVWRSDRDAGAGGAANGLVARHLNGQGRPRGAEARVSAEGDQEAQYASFAQSPGGQVLLAWEGCCDAGGDLGIFVRAYDSSTGAFGPVRQVNVVTAQKQRRPTLAADGDRGFLVLWQGIIDRTTGHIFGRFVDLTGEPTAGQFQVSHGHGPVQVAPAVAAKPDGGYLAVWRDWVGVYFGVTAVELDAAGQPQGEPVRLNSRGLQKTGRTSLATDGAGTFLVPYEKGFKGRPAIGASRIEVE